MSKWKASKIHWVFPYFPSKLCHFQVIWRSPSLKQTHQVVQLQCISVTVNYLSSQVRVVGANPPTKILPPSREGGQSVHGFLLLSAPWRMIRWIRSWWTPLSESVHRLGTYHLEVPKKTHRNRTEGLVCDHSNDFLRCSVSLCHFDCPFMSMMDIAHCLFFVFSQTRFNHAIVLRRTPNPLEVPRPFIFHQGSFFMKNSPISVGGSHLSAVVRQSLEGSQNSWETNEFGGMVMVPWNTKNKPWRSCKSVQVERLSEMLFFSVRDSTWCPC